MTFFSIDELNTQIQSLLETYNDQLFSKRNTTRRQEFLAIEKEHLVELPSSTYQIRYHKQLTVQKMGHVYLSDDKNYYSVPYRLIGKKVSLMYSSNTVEIFSQKERVALHKRDYTPGIYSTHEEHRSSSAKAYSDWSLPYFQQRAKIIGFFTNKYITELIEQKPYPELDYKQSQGILALSKQYTAERLEQACQRASDIEKRSYNIVENILKNGMDQEHIQVENVLPNLINPNVRGANYYQ